MKRFFNFQAMNIDSVSAFTYCAICSCSVSSLLGGMPVFRMLLVTGVAVFGVTIIIPTIRATVII